MMEDERIARTLLSALLQKKVVKVEMRPHDYANTQQERISIFRIDFGAYILDYDSNEITEGVHSPFVGGRHFNCVKRINNKSLTSYVI